MRVLFLRLRGLSGLFLLLSLVSCSLPGVPFLQAQPTQAGSLRPKFVNYTAPALSMDMKIYRDVGCKADEEGKLRCSPSESPFNRLGCYEVVPASALLGGLKPSAVLMLCLLEPQPDQKIAPEEYLFDLGCLEPSFVRYVVYRDRQFTLVRNLNELKAAFAPIESPTEALSYAMAATGFQALFGLKDDNMRYLVSEISDTNVKTVGDVYDVTLYSYTRCGCGPHTMNRRIVHVSPQGDINVDDPLPVWEDPTQDEVCSSD